MLDIGTDGFPEAYCRIEKNRIEYAGAKAVAVALKDNRTLKAINFGTCSH